MLPAEAVPNGPETRDIFEFIAHNWGTLSQLPAPAIFVLVVGALAGWALAAAIDWLPAGVGIVLGAVVAASLFG